MVRRSWLFTLFCAASWELAAADLAHAYEEQASVDLALGAGGIGSTAALPPALLGVDLGGTVGITDGLTVRTALGYAAALGAEQSTPMARGRLELAYALDILQWVPFFGLGAGLWGAETSGSFKVTPEGHALLGLDYLASRSWTYGFDLRGGGVLLSGDRGWFLDGQLRISRMFELF